MSGNNDESLTFDCKFGVLVFVSLEKMWGKRVSKYLETFQEPLNTAKEGNGSSSELLTGSLVVCICICNDGPKPESSPTRLSRSRSCHHNRRLISTSKGSKPCDVPSMLRPIL